MLISGETGRVVTNEELTAVTERWASLIEKTAQSYGSIETCICNPEDLREEIIAVLFGLLQRHAPDTPEFYQKLVPTIRNCGKRMLEFDTAKGRDYKRTYIGLEPVVNMSDVRTPEDDAEAADLLVRIEERLTKTELKVLHAILAPSMQVFAVFERRNKYSGKWMGRLTAEVLHQALEIPKGDVCKSLRKIQRVAEEEAAR
jgi:hypothetical protein